MKNKLTTALASLAAFAAASASAQDLPTLIKDANYSVTFDNTFASNYVFRGLELAEDTFHPSMEITVDDFYIGAWASLPFEKEGYPNFFADEYDLYGGYGFKINDTLSLDVGATLFIFQEAQNTFEPYVGFNYDVNGFTPSFYVYRDVDLETFTFEWSAGYSYPISDMASLELSGHFGIVTDDDAPRPIEDYSYFGASVELPVRVRENATVTFGVHYTENDIDRRPVSQIEGRNLYGSLSLTVGL